MTTFEVSGDAYDRFMGRYAGPLAQQFVEMAELQHGDRLLDVGCGPGTLTKLLGGARRAGRGVWRHTPAAPGRRRQGVEEPGDRADGGDHQHRTAGARTRGEQGRARGVQGADRQRESLPATGGARRA